MTPENKIIEKLITLTTDGDLEWTQFSEHIFRVRYSPTLDFTLYSEYLNCQFDEVRSEWGDYTFRHNIEIYAENLLTLKETVVASLTKPPKKRYELLVDILEVLIDAN